MLDDHVRLSVHLMVRDGAAVVGRMLESLRGVLPPGELELCFVDTGSVDDTPDVLVRTAGRLGMSVRGTAISPLSRPDLYFPDQPSSFRRGLPGPYTGLPLLRDWSAARNLGLQLCAGDYVMKLDADDEVLDPEKIGYALQFLDARPTVDVVTCPYEIMMGPLEGFPNPRVADPPAMLRGQQSCPAPHAIMDGQGELEHVEMYTRIWRRRPEIYFREICHENVDWCKRAVPVDDSTMHFVENTIAGDLRFRDHRDSLGRGARAPLRNLKVLLREYERLEAAREAPTAHLCMYLASEARRRLPLLALEVLEEWVSGLDLHPGDRAWYCAVRGEALEAIGDNYRAVSDYEEAGRGGHARALLLRALLLRRMSQTGWQAELVRAVERCRGGFYPMTASRPELARAESLLRGVNES